MPIPAGQFDQRVVFELKTETTNSQGQIIGTWTESFTDWARYIPTSETSAEFAIRNRRDPSGSKITPKTHRILHDGSYWSVIDPVPDRRGVDLLIRCDFSAKIEVTHLQSTEKDFIDGLPLSRPRDE